MSYIPILMPTEVAETFISKGEKLSVKDVPITEITQIEALNNMYYWLNGFSVIMIALILFFGLVITLILLKIKNSKNTIQGKLLIPHGVGESHLTAYRKGKPFFSSLYETIEHSEGGVLKRIDENRELLELLYKDAPDFIGNHKWVIEWFKSQDNFLLQLAEKTTIKESDFIRVRPFPIDKE
ncbi:hypothetical protein [Providencia huaxiensis]|uniref:hypothetical protein n=1 Tax=Providencia huaxiensis TaxID=2027290 RepID=UPI000C7F6A66|nr:hypothetical protein [Providencia huaxiensis]AXH60520.1 hypothetical protein CYG50_00015 [Providencia huaxiensis]